MAVLALNPFRRAPLAHREPQDRFVPGNAELLKGLSGSLSTPWAVLGGLIDELSRLAGTRPLAPRPEVRFFPIAIDLAHPALRDAVANELADLIALLDPAVEGLASGAAANGDVTTAAQALLDRAQSARDRLATSVPSEVTA